MADGTAKKIEDVVEGDLIKTFDHEAGSISSSKVYIAWQEKIKPEKTFKLHFDGGLTVHCVKYHCFLEKESRKYKTFHIDNAANYVGQYFFGEDGNWHKLESVSIEEETDMLYEVYTAKHQNAFTDGMLSVPDDVEYMLNIYELDENLKADEKQLEADVEQYGYTSFEYLSERCDMTREWYDAASAKYLSIAIGKGLITEEDAQQVYEDFMEPKDAEVPLGKDEDTKEKAAAVVSSVLGWIGSRFVMTAYAEETSVWDAYSSNIFTIGPKTNITGNKVGDRTENACLKAYDEAEDSDWKESLIEMVGSMEEVTVGVTRTTVSNEPDAGRITKNGTLEDEVHFPSDRSEYLTKYNDGGYLELAEAYEITAESVENGSVSTDYKYAYEGATVTVTAAPHPGFTLEQLKAYKTGEESTIVDMIDNTFTMPNFDITVSAVFSHKHDGVELKNANLSDYLEEDKDTHINYLKEGSYYLGEDLNLTETLKIVGVGGKEVTLCLNGHTINAENVPTGGANSGAAIRITAKGADTGILNLFDCDVSVEKGGITGAPGCGIWLECGTLQMNGGTVTGNKRGISVQGGCSISLSGNATVTGNDDSNLSLSLKPGMITNPPSFEKITVSDSFTGSIGIRLQDTSGSKPNVHYGVFSTANTTDLHEKFSSDLPDYSIAFNTDKCLEVLEEAAVTIQNQKGTELKKITGYHTGHKIILPTELKTGYDFKEYSYEEGISSRKIEKGGEFVIPEKATVLKAELSIVFKQQPTAKQPAVATEAAGVSYQWHERETVSDPVSFTSGGSTPDFFADSDPLSKGQICHLTFPDGAPAGLTFTCGTAVKTGENTYDVTAAMAYPKKFPRIGMTATEPITVEATTDRIVDTPIAGETSDALSKQESCRTYFCRVTDGEGIFTDSYCFTSGHQHAWSYSLSEDGKTVTAVCKGTGTCDYSGTDKTLTIAAPGALMYNGNSHDAELGNTSFHGETLPTVSYLYKESAGGTYEPAADTKNAGFYKASFTAGEGTGAKTASVEYTVAKRSVTLTSGSASKTYDSTPLTKSEVSAGGDGFVSGEGADYTVTGSQTAVGTSKNTFSYQLKSGTKAQNYSITTVEGDLTVTPVGSFSVSFDAKGGTPEPAVQTVAKDGKVTKPADPKKTSYIFTGWYQDEEEQQLWDFDADTVKADLKLYAGWEEKEIPEYDVFFEMNGHGEQVATQSVAQRSKVERPEDPEEEGYVFLGWYKSSALKEAWDFLCDVVTQTTTLYANWKKGDCAVRFNAAGIGDLYLSEGETIELPAAVKDGFTFSGWEDPEEEGGVLHQAGESYTVTGDVNFCPVFTKIQQIGEKKVAIGDLQGPVDTEAVQGETKAEKLIVLEIRDGKIAAGYESKVSSGILSNAMNAYLEENPDADELLFGINVRLTDVQADEDGTSSTTRLVYNVKPYVRALKNGVAVSEEQEVENSAIGSKVKFCLPMPTNALKYAKTEHMDADGVTVKDTVYYEVKTAVNKDGVTEKYVEAESGSFSDFVVTFTDTKPKHPDPTPDPKPVITEDEEPQNWWKTTDAGWILKPGTEDWYYIENHALLKGWHKDSEDGYWYYMDPSTGKMLTGWRKVNDKWYYLNPEKKQQTWFKKEDGKWHYDVQSVNRPYGSMYQNEATPDGYKVGTDGAWIK